MDALEGFLPVEQSEVNLHEPSKKKKKVTFRQFLSDAHVRLRDLEVLCAGICRGCHPLFAEVVVHDSWSTPIGATYRRCREQPPTTSYQPFSGE